MVAKIMKGQSLYGALVYNHVKVDNQVARVLGSSRIRETADGTINLQNSLSSFEPYLIANKRTEKPVIHISLNPHPKDVLSDEQMRTIGEEYLEKLGYGDQPYIIYKHEDIDRPHLHIVTVGIDENGKKINDSYEHRRSKTITDELEIKYNLRQSSDKSLSESTGLQPIEYKKGNLKKQVSNTLKSLSDYRFHSLTEYKALLSLYNVTFEEVKGVHNDQPYHGIVYFVTNRRGEKVSKGFKSSLYGKEFGAGKLNSNVARTKKQNLKYDKELLKNKISNSILTSKNLRQLVNHLKKQNIDFIERRNDQGRLYGITYIDHNTKLVINGSGLGKEFSANHISALFDKPDLPKNSNESLSNQLIEDFSGLLSLSNQGEDFEETAFARRMRKRKRRK